MADDDHKLGKPSTTSKDPVSSKLFKTPVADDDDDKLGKPSTTSKDPAVGSGGVVAADESAKSEESNKQLEFTGDEETLIIRMYNLVGERWSLIAGRIPGRSAEEIEKYWNSRNSTSK